MNAESAYIQDEFFEGLLADFLDEASQLLDRLNEDLLVLDQWAATVDPQNGERFDDELMNSMFRSAHSIKGLSAMLGLQNVKVLTHRIENVFDAARKDKLTLNTDAVEVIFRSVDVLVEMVKQIRTDGNDDVKADKVLLSIQEILQAAEAESEPTEPSDAEEIFNNLNQSGSISEPPAPTDQPNESNDMTSSSKPATASKEIEVVANSAPPIDHFAEIVDETDVPPKYLSIFIDETEESLDSLTETLLNVEVENNGETTQTLLIISHRIKGSAASVGLNRPAKLAHLMEDILQELREAGEFPTSSMVDAMLKCTDALRHYVIGLKSGEPESDIFNEIAHCLLAVKDAPETEVDSTEAGSGANEVKPDATTSESNNPGANTAGEHVIGFDDALVSSLKSKLYGVFHALAGRVHFEQDLPLAGLKGRLVYEKLSHLGEVIHCEPEADNLEELEHLETLTFAIKSDETPDSMKAKLKISGVTSIEMITLIDQSDEAAAVSTRSAPTKSEQKTTLTATATPQPGLQESPANSKTKPSNAPAKKSVTKPNETLRVDIERLDQLMNLAGQLVIN
ncbi:MAG: Hpt domain-containing protein, partial [Planctomycetes bacterium]|nr:Hpt domain-containing protein [Planctomycetota bacterium]